MLPRAVWKRQAGLDALDKSNQLADLLHREGGAGLIALGTLDGDQLGLFVDGRPDALVIETAVGQQIHLTVGHSVFHQRTFGRANTNDLFQGVVGFAHGRKQFIPGQ